MRLAALLLAGLVSQAMTAPAPPQPVTIVAHRGLAEGMPENTLAAFRHSIERGIAMIELDLRATKDGQLIVLHDKTLDRTTDCSGPASALDLATIKSCDAGNGQRVPSFAEVLELVRGKPVRLLADVKGGTPIAPVLQAVRDHQAGRQVVLGLRTTRLVARARAALPETTILGYMPAEEDAQAFAAAGADIIRLWSDWADADPRSIARARAVGPEVWIMVGRRLPRKPADWQALHQRMIAAGAQGLITDRPDLISAP